MIEPTAERVWIALTLRAQGHDPTPEVVDRIARLRAGELTVEGAYAEVDAANAAECRPAHPQRGPGQQ